MDNFMVRQVICLNNNKIQSYKTEHGAFGTRNGNPFLGDANFTFLPTQPTNVLTLSFCSTFLLPMSAIQLSHSPRSR